MQTHLFHSGYQPVDTASPYKIPAGLSDLFFILLLFIFFFLEEFQVRDVGVEKIYDLIISLIFLMDFHASVLAPHGCLFSFLLQSGLRCSAPKSVTECPCPEQDFFLLFFP